MDLTRLPCYVDGFDLTRNLRDCGGWPTREGRTVKRGLIYRSARLHDLCDQELVRLMELGVSYVVDLRPREEAALFPDPKLPSMSHVFADAGRDVTPEGNLLDLTPREVIAAAASQTAAMAFKNEGAATVLRMLEQEKLPLLFHCNTGRDRSGVVAMIVLMALGCTDDVLLADYLLTNAYRQEALSVLHGQYGELVQSDTAYGDLLTLLVGVLPQVGQAVLDAIDERYSSRDAFLETEYGFDAARRAVLQERLTL